MQKAGSGGSGRSGSRGPGRPMRNGIFMRAAGTYGPSEPGPVAGQAQCLGGHTALPRWETELSWLDAGQQRWHGSSVTLAPPGARKRSGKNLVFPRDPAAAPADYLQVISALCRNNTPPKLQKIPRRFPPGDFFAAASAAADALDHQISGLASAGRALG